MKLNSAAVILPWNETFNISQGMDVVTSVPRSSDLLVIFKNKQQIFVTFILFVMLAAVQLYKTSKKHKYTGHKSPLLFGLHCLSFLSEIAGEKTAPHTNTDEVRVCIAHPCLHCKSYLNVVDSLMSFWLYEKGLYQPSRFCRCHSSDTKGSFVRE